MKSSWPPESERLSQVHQPTLGGGAGGCKVASPVGVSIDMAGGSYHSEKPAAAALVRDVPVDERPRERLLKGGAEGLSDAELLAVLLRTGTRGVSVVSLARGLLEDVGGLAGLASTARVAWKRSGIGAAKQATIMAALEVGRRLARLRVPDRTPLADPGAIADYLRMSFLDRDQETMGVVYLDSRHRLLDAECLFRGTLTRAAVEPRPILRQALLKGAGTCVLFHTHPSGDPRPSAEDVAFTRRMMEAGDPLGVRLADHLILGASGRWWSMRSQGPWPEDLVG